MKFKINKQRKNKNYVILNCKPLCDSRITYFICSGKLDPTINDPENLILKHKYLVPNGSIKIKKNVYKIRTHS